MSRTLGVGVIGLGFIGRTHLHAWRALQRRGLPCKVVAVCDRDAARAELDADGSVTTTEPRELLARADVDIVSLCTPTDSHVELALAALAAGKHVLVEKPLALHAREVEPLAAAARAARTRCMPALCMRWWPGWDWLAARVRENTFGAVRSATFQRLGAAPAWSSFYADAGRSGGALVDLHVHDADMVRWLFGEPDEVITSGTLAHGSTQYRCARGPAHVLAEFGADHAPGFAFRMRYAVAFERATADFDLARTPPLLLAREGRSEAVELPAVDAYEAQAAHFLEAALDPALELRASVEDGLAVARLLDAERESLLTGRPVRLR